MLARFSLYDFIAVIMPGLFFIWALTLTPVGPTLRATVNFSGGLSDTSILIVIGYVTGLILHGISGRVTEKFLLFTWGGFPSARWLLPTDRTLSRTYKAELAFAVKEKFGADMPGENRETAADVLKRNQEIFYRCYRAVEKLSELPQTFVAQYGLYRSLFTVFAVLIILGGWSYIVDYHWQLGSKASIALGAWLVGMCVSYWQVKKRGEDFAKSVYDVFLANFPAKQANKEAK